MFIRQSVVVVVVVVVVVGQTVGGCSVEFFGSLRRHRRHFITGRAGWVLRRFGSMGLATSLTLSSVALVAPCSAFTCTHSAPIGSALPYSARLGSASPWLRLARPPCVHRL